MSDSALSELLQVPVLDYESKQLLKELNGNLKLLLQFLLAEPLVERHAVSAPHPLYIDHKDRRHLYLLSPTALAAVYSDLAAPIGSSTLPPLAIRAGFWFELPFEDGTQVAFPAVALSAEVTVLLLATNAELMFNG